MLNRRDEPDLVYEEKRKSMQRPQLHINPIEQQFEEKKAEWQHMRNKMKGEVYSFDPAVKA